MLLRIMFVGTILVELIYIFLIGQCEANPDAKRLYDDLLSNYNRLIRPVGNNSDRLTVKMGLRLSQLIDVVRNIKLLKIWRLLLIFFSFSLKI